METHEMAIIQDDIVEVVTSGELLGQLVENRYHFRLITFPSGSGEADVLDALIDNVITDILGAVRVVQSDAMVWRQVTAKNLNSETARTISLIEQFGLLTGSDPLPSLVSYSFQLLLPSDSIKWGRKSYAGLAEESIDGNEPTAATLVNLAAIENILETAFIDANGDTWDLVVARIPAAAERPFVPASLRVSNAAFKGIGTQYSRKKGNGA